MADGLAGGGISSLGKTQKQQEMARAYNPAANNKQNLSLTPEKSGVVKAEEAKLAQEQSSGQENRAQTQRTAQTATGIPQVAGLQTNLGIFNQQLIAQVNQFVSGAPISAANAQLTSGGQAVFNAGTGQWEAPAAQVNANIGGLVDEKEAQQNVLRQSAGDMFNEKGQAKSFEEVLKKFGDVNRDGVLDAAEQQWVNEAFDAVNAIRRLKQTDPYSAEAQALKAQLALKDKNGLVSGILQALDTYEKIVGMKVTGADADAYYLRDLLTMGQDQLQSEIQKALTQSSGLFGAEYQAYVNREVDKSARQYTESAREDATVMQRLKEVSTNWLKNFETQFEEGRVALNNMFQSAADSLVKELDNKAKETGDMGILQAKEWFVDTQTLTREGGKDFSKVIFQALVDSKFGAEPKRILKKWLGRTIGADTVEKGVLAALMEKISNTGYFWTENQYGQQVQVAFDARQKMDIVRVMSDNSLSDGEKTAKIEGIIDAASQGMGTNIRTDLGKVIGPIQSGQLQQGLNNWQSAMVTSMSDFNGSLVQGGYTAAVDQMGRAQPPEAIQAVILQQAQAKLDEINNAYEQTKAAVGELQTKMQKDRDDLGTNIIDAQDLHAKGVGAVQSNYKNAAQSYSSNLATPEKDAQGNIVKEARIATYFRQAFPKGTLPSDLYSEKYTKPMAAVLMAKNLMSLEDKAFDVLVSDYFGGQKSDLVNILNNPQLALTRMDIATKLSSALQSLEFANAVWMSTSNAKAIDDKVTKNKEAIDYSNKKMEEANGALLAMEESMKKAREKIGMAVKDSGKLAADISQETANRMFNMAVEGQAMQFTDAPDIDPNVMRALANIQYTKRAAGGDPSGLAQYAEGKWVTDGSLPAQSAPNTQTLPPSAGVGKLPEQTFPKETAVPGATDTVNKDGRRERTVPTEGGKITITETSNPNTVIVTKEDGTQVFAGVSRPAGGGAPIFTGDIGALNPDVPPKGIPVADNKSTAWPESSKGPGEIKPPESTEQSTWEKIVSKLTPEWLKPTSEQQAKDAAKAAASEMAAEKAKQGETDARFGAPPESADPAYMDGYNKVRKEDEERAKNQAKIDADKAAAEKEKAEQNRDKGDIAEKPAPEKPEKTEGEKELERRGITED
jgi:hypothetical protein